MAEHSDNIINDERKSLGLYKRDKDDATSFIQSDAELFKTWIATPREPTGTDRRKVKVDGKDEIFESAIPKMVPTMALGNLNTKEVQLMRLYLEMARRAQRHGYMNVAINLFYKVVFLCVSSQSHMAFLARQLFTENVNVVRKEETYADTKNSTPQEKDKLGGLMDKIKGADGTTMWGKGGMDNSGVKNSGSYGMRSS